MKKLYFLNEEEKQRILRLHNERKYFLNEQTNESTSTLPKGTWTKEQKEKFNYIVNEFTPSMWVAGRDTLVAALKDFCNSNVFGAPTLSNEAIKTNSQKFEYTMKRNAYTIADTQGRGFYNPPELRPLVVELINIPNFCWSVKNIKNLRASDETIVDIADEIAYDSAFVANFLDPLKALADATPIGVPGEGDDSDVTDDDNSTENTVNKRKGKKANIKGKEGTTYISPDLTEEFSKLYPCFEGIATETKDARVVYILNPSSHDNIIDVTTGIPTTINEKTYFKSDGTYRKISDSRKNINSGTFECGFEAGDIMLTPGKAGVGVPGGINSKFPCLAKFNVIERQDMPSVGEMSDDIRAKHPTFSTYPEGKIYFRDNGTFVTEYDYDNDIDVSGTFSCKGLDQEKIKADKYKGADYSPRKEAPSPENRLPKPALPDNTDPNKKSEETKKSEESKKVIPQPVIGMGTVMSSVQGEIAGILQCANIVGSDLTQGNLNLLYQYIKNNK